MADEDARPDAPVTSTSVLLLTLTRRIESELGEALAGLGLTVGRLGMLGHIAGVPGISFSDLARMSRITVQSAHTAVKALKTAGLVQDDTARAGAASTISLTDEGHRVLREAMGAVSGVDERLFGAEADPAQRRIGEAVRSAFAAGR
ncbi:MarR family winged helix-turn-helix transcriptional regulator [Nocardiopsis ganjiahuensis]|uniref:MarR family winged helix-turn-helix transcriptional regulator n=1 Tax=Nocardiopsis ganjiahuensis TaxID=239984 RepID=UPI0003469487|nr:MarR family winged helix-turn-helix transcriptional regulator [Nocardiopsis ganjiahuensis]